MRKLWKAFLEIVFPPSELTAHIEALARNNNLRSLPEAEKTTEPWMNALFAYRDRSVRTLVWQTKYQANSALIEAVGSLLAEEIMHVLGEKNLFADGTWILVPIPASSAHKKEKGFNQTELLCREIMKNTPNSLVYKPNVLKKIKETKPQTSVKNRNEREQNVMDSMTALSEVEGKNVIVIDDVITTGSTIQEARRALKEGGAKEVLAFALAH